MTPGDELDAVPAGPVPSSASGERLLDLVRVMARLRGSDGCPWDREQTHASLRRFLLEETYEALEALDSGDVPGALAEWDAVRRRFETWCTLARLRFDQNTADPAAVADRDHADGLAPEAADRDTTVKSRLLALPDRDRLVALAGGHMVRLWECDVATFAPSIKADLEEESRLTARYTALLASAAFDFDGRTVNLSGLAPFAEDPNRAIRHRAETLRWRFFAENGDELDSIYGQLVALRHKMATTLGFESFVPLAYKRMRRTDYGPEDVAQIGRAHV